MKFHELWSVKKKTQKGEETKENVDDVALTASEDLDTEYLQSADKVEGYLNEFKGKTSAFWENWPLKAINFFQTLYVCNLGRKSNKITSLLE